MPAAGSLIRRVLVGDVDWLRIERTEFGHRYDFPELAVFAAHSQSNRIVGYPAVGTEVSTLRHLLLDQVFPLHFAAQGHTVLHGSSVSVGPPGDQISIIFLGPSGAGKSSMAAGCWMAGGQLLADDFCLITPGPRPGVMPALVGVRLWGDTASKITTAAQRFRVAQFHAKQRLIPAAGPTDPKSPVPIGALVMLGPRLEPNHPAQLERTSAAAAMMQIVEHSHRVDVTSREANKETLDAAAHIVETVPTFTLRVPASLDALEATCLAVMNSVLQAIGRQAEQDDVEACS